MTVREMHYDFKQKLNKVDSQKYRNLKIPEIDWKLNEAQEVFVKIVAQPRIGKEIGFEVNQRTIDDIRTIVVNQKPTNAQALTNFDDSSFTCSLPEDYWFYISSKVIATKGSCENKLLKSREVQHDDEADLSIFDRSSFEWRVANIRFIKEGIRVFTDGSFIPSKIILNYLLRPRRIFNGQDWNNGSGYIGVDGNLYTGTQDSELPDGVHKEIVDLAVFITAGDLDLVNYQFKRNKLSLTQTK